MLKRINTIIPSTARAYALTSTAGISNVVAKVNQSVEELPLREFARYADKNQKFTAEQLMSFVNSHAECLIENGYKKGDTLAVWLPDNCPEKHVIFLSAAKAGLPIVDISPDVTNINRIREALALSNAKAIYFFPQREKINYIKLLRKSIPEFFYYDDTKGQLFHSKHFPKLRWFIHLGPEVEMGALAFQGLFVRDSLKPLLPEVEKTTDDKQPFYTRINRKEDGSLEVQGPIELGKVLETPAWTFAKKLLAKEFVEFN